MAFSQNVAIRTILIGAREFITGVKGEAAALVELAGAADESAVALRKTERGTFVANQALFTSRRLVTGLTFGLVAAGAEALKLGFNYQSAMQTAHVALQPMFKDTAQLNKELTELFGISAFSPFQFKDITLAYRSLAIATQGLNIDNKTLNETIQSVVNTLSASGRTSPAQLNRVAVALQHMMLQGRVTGQVVTQLARDGLFLVPALRKEFGLTGDQIHRLGTLAITPLQALEALNKYVRTTPVLANAAFRQSQQSLTGAFTTFRDFLSQAFGGSEGGIFYGLTGFFRGINEQIYRITDGGKRTATLTDFVTALDKAITGKSHVILDFFSILAGIVEGVKKSIDLLGFAIKLVFWPFDQLGSKFDDLTGHSKLLQRGLFLLGITIGVEISLLLGLRAATYLVLIMTSLVGREFLIVRLAMWLWGLTVAVVTGLEWLLNYALVATAGGLEILPFLIGLVDAAWAGLIITIEEVGVAMGVVMDLLLGPVGWIALAIAGLTLLYFKWGWFHNAVSNTLMWVKTHWIYIAAALIDPMLLATLVIHRYWSSIESAARSLLGIITSVFTQIKNVVRDAIDWIIRGWNRLRFHIPGFHVPHTHIGWGGITVGVTPVPLLAQGGIALRGGMAIVGEHGPELLSLSPGATVAPLPNYGNIGMLRGLTIKVYPQDVYLDGTKVATVVSKAVTDAEARL
jgi:Tape measure protein